MKIEILTNNRYMNTAKIDAEYYSRLVNLIKEVGMNNFCKYHNVYNYEDVNKIAQDYLEEALEGYIYEAVYNFELHGIDELLELAKEENEIIQMRLIDQRKETN